VRYGLAALAVALALAARFVLAPFLLDEAPYLVFVPAVLLAAAAGGLGPGLLATGLSVMLGSIFIAPAPYETSQLVHAIIFLLIGGGIAWSGERLQRYRRRAEASTHDALGREAHLQSILDTCRMR
jgi:two-component system sensor kinase FixL